MWVVFSWSHTNISKLNCGDISYCGHIIHVFFSPFFPFEEDSPTRGTSSIFWLGEGDCLNTSDKGNPANGLLTSALCYHLLSPSTFSNACSFIRAAFVFKRAKSAGTHTLLLWMFQMVAGIFPSLQYLNTISKPKKCQFFFLTIFPRSCIPVHLPFW